MKKPKNILLKRLMQMVLPMMALFVLIIGSSFVEITPIKSDSANFYVRATVTEIVEDYSNGRDFMGTQLVKAVISSGEYKGYECELENSNSYQRGALCTEGTKIIALVRANDDGSLSGSVYNYDRSVMIYILVGLFALSLIAVGGKR